jgi:hypothetical protein
MPVKGWNKYENLLDMNNTIDKLERDLNASNVDLTENNLETNTFDPAPIIEIAKQDIDMLAGLAMPTVFEFPYPPILRAVWSLLLKWVVGRNKFPQLALGIPRGHAKTTLVKLFILYCILYTDCRFILVIGQTLQRAEDILADVVDMLNEKNIKDLYGDWKIGLEKNITELKKFVFRGRPIILAAIGAEGSLRGMNLKNERPDVMIFEDVQSKECSESDVQSAALERWMIGTAMKAKSPKGCLFIFVGNMYPGPNSILKKLKSNPRWIKFISGAILANGTALWPELRSLQSLLDELDNDIAMAHPEIFFSEVLNDTEAGINTRTDLAKIKDWPWREDEEPQGKFIIIDPSANKQGGDEVAIGYCEVYDAVPALREVIEERLSPGNTIRRALLLALCNGVRCIAVESTSYQATLLYWFGVIATQLCISGIEFVEVHSGSVSKNSRISTMLRSLTAGEIIIHPSVKSQVIHQIANWNPLRRNNVDGILDLMVYMPRVLELYGPSIAVSSDPLMQEAESSGVVEDNYPF